MLLNDISVPVTENLPFISTSPINFVFPVILTLPVWVKIPVALTLPVWVKIPAIPTLPVISKPFVAKTPAVNVMFEEIFGARQAFSLSLTNIKLPVAVSANASIFSAHELVSAPQ